MVEGERVGINVYLPCGWIVTYPSPPPTLSCTAALSLFGKLYLFWVNLNMFICGNAGNFSSISWRSCEVSLSRSNVKFPPTCEYFRNKFSKFWTLKHFMKRKVFRQVKQMFNLTKTVLVTNWIVNQTNLNLINSHNNIIKSEM